MKTSYTLNPAQKEASEHTNGPLLILAGAGAGKTRVIVHRIVNLVLSGIAPERILAITFTNKAAHEMRERLRGSFKGSTLTAGSSRSNLETPFVSTFHSLGLTILKENYRLLGFKRFPAVYDRADSLRAMKDVLKRLGVGEAITAQSVLATISRQKGEGVDLKTFENGADDSRERIVAEAWRAYTEALNKDQALDFDDLLLKAYLLLQKNPALQAFYQKRWSHMHIDEYQDTNTIQALLSEKLLTPEKNICAVGDIDQTIYSWRGAQISNILSFDKKFPGAKIVLLEENYRSTKNILSAANEVISKNQYRREKNLFTKNTEGPLISLYQAFDETDEALFVARKITELIQTEKLSPKDFAVLYRANFQSRALEETLLGARIPHQVLGTRFFERKEVKDVLSYVRAALYETSADIARIANVPPRGVGKVTLLKMLSGQPAGEKAALFKAILSKIKKASEKLSPAELVTFTIRESGIEKMLNDDRAEGKERLENLRELVSLASRYTSIEEFLESAALASDQDELKDDANAVKLMTVHAAKGLEFPHVFIVGLEEGLFPYEREDTNAEDREEERRLMYVALTRAQKKVYLSYGSYRTLFGSKNPTLPSQFLSDIPQELLELESPERLGRTIYLD